MFANSVLRKTSLQIKSVVASPFFMVILVRFAAYSPDRTDDRWMGCIVTYVYGYVLHLKDVRHPPPRGRRNGDTMFP